MSNVNFVYLTSDLAFLPKQGNQALSQPFVAGLTSVSEPEFLIIIKILEEYVVHVVHVCSTCSTMSKLLSKLAQIFSIFTSASA